MKVESDEFNRSYGVFADNLQAATALLRPDVQLLLPSLRIPSIVAHGRVLYAASDQGDDPYGELPPLAERMAVALSALVDHNPAWQSGTSGGRSAP